MSGPLKYEWVRITTVRSTWILIALAVLVPAGLALLVAWLVQVNGGGGQGPGARTQSGVVGLLPISAAILCTIGAAAFGQEYRHELIRITLSLFPRRTPVFLAKAVMVIVFAAVTAVVAIAVISLAEYLGSMISNESWSTDIVGVPGLLAIGYVTIFVLIAFALTALTRNQPLGIIVPIVLSVLIEPIIGGIASAQQWTWMDWVLPFSNGAVALDANGAESWGHLAIFGGWFLVLAIPAWLLFLRRDA